MNSVMLMYEENHLARNSRRFTATAIVSLRYERARKATENQHVAGFKSFELKTR